MNKQAALLLMTKKGSNVLKSLAEAGFSGSISKVVIGKDENQYDFSEEIKTICEANGISYLLKGDSYSIEKFGYVIAIGWRWMIEDAKNLIVLHDSLLPKYRGFAPLVNALLNKEETIGATAIWGSEKYDEGDILLQKSFRVKHPIKIENAIDLMGSCYAEIVCKIFQMILDGQELSRIPQKGEKATYSLWRDEEDYHIDWTQSSEKIQLMVNTLGHPYKGAYTLLGNEKVRILDVEIMEDVSIARRDCGKVLFLAEGKPSVVCGTGVLKIQEAIYDETQESVFPLKVFRTRFR
ncbi:formyltransferase family protein [Moorena sp. SIO3E8]|uniref:methionyl-tRNA formyltransferase n=1 Tax=Moorena sp. SIO3E8 TaxID=2607830 RepID=UPI001418AA8C|nr:formyltransferase family protein [Moorena sp. SIO3E8]NEO17778.1 methionyl-tRNA formyltransferase [Moorena sp. SIO3E8]